MRRRRRRAPADIAEIERTLAASWAEALGLEEVELDADFFELGGDSLAALEIAAAASDRFGVEVFLDTIATARTVRSLARGLERELAPPGRGASAEP